MKIKEVFSALERFAPLPLQDGFDNAGLQIGLTDVEATGALLCLDVTESVIDQAIDLGYNIVISHHPLLFKGLKSITGKDYIEHCIIKAIKNDIVIYSAHTNLDNAYGGVNHQIADKIGLQSITALQPQENSLLKLVTFVPTDYLDTVRTALLDAGCGHIGNYDSCSFSASGEGSYRALEGANPFLGSVNKLHYEMEARLETILPSYKKSQVLKALLASHPYEEPAFEFYSLLNNNSQVGSGIVGELVIPEKDIDFLERVKKQFGVACLKHNATSDKMIRRVAICGGSGAFLIPQALGSGADAFITGEIKYHDYFGHDNKILLVDIGHYESEQFTAELFYSILHNEFPDLSIQITNINTNPIKYL